MQKILDAFQQFFELIGIAFDYLGTLLEHTFHFLRMIPSCIEMLISTVRYLPPELILFATLSISVSIVFLLVGRGRTN